MRPQVAILDMGQPVRIWHLAERLIRMNGLRPGTEIVGGRPEVRWEDTCAAVVGDRKNAAEQALAHHGTGGWHRSAERSPTCQLTKEFVERDEELLLRSLLEESVGLNQNPRAGIGVLRERAGFDIGRSASESRAAM
ncbi:MAG TPA: hypothetical protein VNL18_11045 [Gemmatimonadales bacterium]|jgi:hypothetical protein|nr:hypothetical protein [Gemmatimonadales bacterium]